MGMLAPGSVGKVGPAIESVGSSVLPRGLGRSYGDSCLNENGYLLSTKWLDKFYGFDPGTGLLKCESGVSLDEILKLFVPRGWFLSVTPGTKFVTVGGAIANDVHGKSHHSTGSFGNSLKQFELLRSDGERFICSRDLNPGLFRATVGGLGLTGVILWAEFALRRIDGPYIEMEAVKFNDIEEFFQLSEESVHGYEHTVSWVDCLSGPGARGIFMRGNNSARQEPDESRRAHGPSRKTMPFDAPPFLLSGPSIRLFNFLHFNLQRKKVHRSCIHYDPFFYPLDGILHWNRLYGKRGFLQWQCAIPKTGKKRALTLILQEVVRGEAGPFLTTLKEFGDKPAEGLLSFPIPGITLALDFPNTGEKLFSFLDRLDRIVADFGGRIYPAKDARMAPGMFSASFSEIENFSGYVDPRLSSSFYRRVGGK
ncbi:MAG: FAD-binding oxidoreductase [Nitrospiraceae bacterium]|nr:MAG: FAD-binding oxidoreductase [Nitrospiraceae bacterium]